ncbi:MAG: CHAD domain-containing protein [Pseudomonas sp.]|uniref:CHAD domain-containing protein n=1 Tax=Pseudomonas sp. TaxID=306 RepID=UPI0033940DD3
MSFHFRAHKQLDQQVRRLADQRLARAGDALTLGNEDGVHEARKRLKEVRGLLRLVRYALGKRCFAQQSYRLRDLGRQLSGRRDAAALVESWDALLEQVPVRFVGASNLPAIRLRLVARVAVEKGSGQEVDTLRAQLRSLRDETHEWHLEGSGFALFEAGLKRSYADGRLALKRAQEHPTDDNLHQWRKRVKDHWYQTRLLSQAWPALFEARQACLKALAERLGEAHDLALLQQLLGERPTLFGELAERKRVARAIAERRERLYRKSLAEGRRLYSDRPAALVERWRRLWSLAVAVAEAQGA